VRRETGPQPRPDEGETVLTALSETVRVLRHLLPGHQVPRRSATVQPSTDSLRRFLIGETAEPFAGPAPDELQGRCADGNADADIHVRRLHPDRRPGRDRRRDVPRIHPGQRRHRGRLRQHGPERPGPGRGRRRHRRTEPQPHLRLRRRRTPHEGGRHRPGRGLHPPRLHLRRQPQPQRPGHLGQRRRAACTSAGATTTSYSYDSADRLVTSGTVYDALGRTTTQASGATIGYYANDLVHQQTSGTSRQT
jgi:hypothetical protein